MDLGPAEKMAGNAALRQMQHTCVEGSNLDCKKAGREKEGERKEGRNKAGRSPNLVFLFQHEMPCLGSGIHYKSFQTVSF